MKYKEEVSRMQIILPDKVKLIIQTLQDEGFEAYAVGGCVRDSLLGRIPDDWDITTSATPIEVKALFRRTVDTGIQHGTVTVMFGKDGYEVTTYRIDGKYEDSRHPKEVIFTPSLSEDLKRRDFTINAMAYNDTVGLVDMFDGLNDLENHVIRAVGNPIERFSEDALRILRAVRFSAQLKFEIEKNTLNAATELRDTLRKISAERIRVELLKLIMSKNPEKLCALYETGIIKVILPKLNTMFETPQNNPHHIYDVGMHTVEALKHSCGFDDELSADEKKILRLALLFHDSGKPYVKSTDENGIDHFYNHSLKSEELTVEMMRDLKFDNDTIARVRRLVKYHDHTSKCSYPKVRRSMVSIGPDLMKLWFIIRECDVYGQNPETRDGKLKDIEEYRVVCNEIFASNDCLTLKDLAVTGKDLIECGIEKGPKIGETLNMLFEHVLDVPDHNNKEYLLNMIKNVE